MTSALIGHTGFVGSHLHEQHAFSARFNSATIGDAAGKEFATVVCAAAPGSMFEANRFPERDQARIDALIADLSAISADRFVLISSIAVLADFAGKQDETTQAFQTDVAYGRNRRRLEAFCSSHFDRCLIVRLPALFGARLKKNFLFDILNPLPSMVTEARLVEMTARFPGAAGAALHEIYALDRDSGMAVIDRGRLDATGQRATLDAMVMAAGLSAVNFTHPDSSFQYYDMRRLWADLSLALTQGLEVIHLAPEPVAARAVYAALTGHDMPQTQARIHHEDMCTGHAQLWERQGSYIADAAAVMAGLTAFFQRETAAGKDARAERNLS